MSMIFRTRTFTRWMRKTGLTDEMLFQAVTEMSQGLLEASLGGNLVKKRVALPGRGKRGSTRTIVATNHVNRWIFLYGFEKNERANLNSDEFKALQELAGEYLALNVKQLQFAVDEGKLSEVGHEDDKTEEPNS
jgi:hypothetical protein